MRKQQEHAKVDKRSEPSICEKSAGKEENHTPHVHEVTFLKNMRDRIPSTPLLSMKIPHSGLMADTSN